jgi:hypothetical protein
MPINARYVLMSDDVRREDSGKFIIVGLYTPDMVVQQIPFLMPTLTFLLNLESDRPGNFGFRTKIEHQETGTVLPQTQAMGMIAIANPQQPGIVAVKFGGVIFNVQGLYSFSLDIDGQPNNPIVSTFNVQLVVAQASPMSMQGGFQR